MKTLDELTHLQVVSTRVALKGGMDPNERDDAGRTMLHRVGLVPEAMRLLLAAGADPNARDNEGKTPLHYGVRPRFDGPALLVDDAVRLLRAAGADVNARDNEGKTPLHQAIGEQSPGIEPATLVAAGADVNVPDNEGKTPLHTIVIRGSAEQQPLFGSVPRFTFLVGAGADVNARDNEGNSPLHDAFSPDARINSSFVRELLAAGADPNARANDGWTPLHLAAEHHFCMEQDALALLKAGAHADATTNAGDKPADLAQNPAMQALLRVHQERRELRQAADEATHQAPAGLPSLGGLAARIDARAGDASATPDQPTPAAPVARRRL